MLGIITEKNRLMKSKEFIYILEREFEKDPFWNSDK